MSFWVYTTWPISQTPTLNSDLLEGADSFKTTINQVCIESLCLPIYHAYNAHLIWMNYLIYFPMFLCNYLHSPLDAPIVSLESQSPSTPVEGTAVRMFCHAHCYPNNFSVEWTFNGAHLEGHGWQINGTTFEKSNVTRTDDGNYTCHVCNDVGCTSSDPVFLDVWCK